MLDDTGQPKLVGNVVVNMALIVVFSKTRANLLRKKGNCRGNEQPAVSQQDGVDIWIQ